MARFKHRTLLWTLLCINHQAIAEIEDVLQAISDPEQIIWDVRSRDEYLGLRSGSARAGIRHQVR